MHAQCQHVHTDLHNVSTLHARCQHMHSQYLVYAFTISVHDDAIMSVHASRGICMHAQYKCMHANSSAYMHSLEGAMYVINV